MHTSPSRRVFAALTIAGALAAVACGTERVASPVDPLKGATGSQRVVKPLAHPENYIEHSRRAIRGTAVMGGCRFSTADSMHAGQHVTEWSVEYDPVSCTLTLAEGEYIGPTPIPHGETRTRSDTLRVLSALGTERLSERPTPRGLPRRLDDVTCDNNLDASFHAYQHLWIEDPIALRVTQDYLHLYWFSRPALSCIQDATYTHTAAWDPDTGWELWNFTTNFAYIAADRSYAIANVTAIMRNPAFCFSITTWNKYDPSEVKGFPDGWTIFYWDVTIEGGCASLLSLHRERFVEGF